MNDGSGSFQPGTKTSEIWGLPMDNGVFESE